MRHSLASVVFLAAAAVTTTTTAEEIRDTLVVTASNLERLFGARYAEFVNSTGDVALLPTGA